jgi:hypothetical protein
MWDLESLQSMDYKLSMNPSHIRNPCIPSQCISLEPKYVLFNISFLSKINLLELLTDWGENNQERTLYQQI